MTVGKTKREVKKIGKNRVGGCKARESRTVFLKLSASCRHNQSYQLAGRLVPESACWMTELGQIFTELGISHYLSEFVEQGFDSWDTILDITESDFDALGVKLGHRRKLQRRIANSRGLSSDRALASPARNTPVEDRAAEEHKQSSATRVDAKDVGGSGPQGAKRKYRRHPKPDDNAPERPPSAYVIFSNKMREELKGQALSFTEIAKLVGENWQSLTPGEKEPYEQQAFTDKERYNNQLAEYKKTSQFKEYSLYLAEFKARQSNQQQATDLDAKRPKLEPHPSTGSSGTGSSIASQHEGDTPTGRVRVESSASSTGQWPVLDQPSPKLSALSGSQAPSTSHNSPNISPPGVLLGFREAKLSAASHQSLPSRQGQPGQHQLPGISSVGARRLSQTGPSIVDPLDLPGPHHQNTRRTMQPAPVHPPPLLASESTNRSTGSSSTNSSAYFSPRTPMEPAVDRPLSIPSLYPQKSYENQLPPIRSSLSPQATMHPQLSPNVVHPLIEHPNSMAPMRGYTTANAQQQTTETHDERLRDYATFDDNNLDPVSALLRAGEIVNQNSRRRP